MTRNNIVKANRFIRIKSFYNNHFPTDKKTFTYRIPAVGFILSILSYQYCVYFFVDFSRAFPLFAMAYIITALLLAVELYWGLTIGDRKQYTPWIILKILEIAATFSILIFTVVKANDKYSYRLPSFITDPSIGMTVSGLLFTVANIILTLYISNKSFGNEEIDEQANNNFEDNIYEFPNCPQETKINLPSQV